jgi:hypothetical protein
MGDDSMVAADMPFLLRSLATGEVVRAHHNRGSRNGVAGQDAGDPLWDPPPTADPSATPVFGGARARPLTMVRTASEITAPVEQDAVRTPARVEKLAYSGWWCYQTREQYEWLLNAPAPGPEHAGMEPLYQRRPEPSVQYLPLPINEYQTWPPRWRMGGDAAAGFVQSRPHLLDAQAHPVLAGVTTGPFEAVVIDDAQSGTLQQGMVILRSSTHRDVFIRAECRDPVTRAPGGFRVVHMPDGLPAGDDVYAFVFEKAYVPVYHVTPSEQTVLRNQDVGPEQETNPKGEARVGFIVDGTPYGVDVPTHNAQSDRSGWFNALQLEGAVTSAMREVTGGNGAAPNHGRLFQCTACEVELLESFGRITAFNRSGCAPLGAVDPLIIRACLEQEGRCTQVGGRCDLTHAGDDLPPTSGLPAALSKPRFVVFNYPASAAAGSVVSDAYAQRNERTFRAVQAGTGEPLTFKLDLAPGSIWRYLGMGARQQGPVESEAQDAFKARRPAAAPISGGRAEGLGTLADDPVHVHYRRMGGVRRLEGGVTMLFGVVVGTPFGGGIRAMLTRQPYALRTAGFNAPAELPATVDVPERSAHPILLGDDERSRPLTFTRVLERTPAGDFVVGADPGAGLLVGEEALAITYSGSPGSLTGDASADAWNTASDAQIGGVNALARGLVTHAQDGVWGITFRMGGTTYADFGQLNVDEDPVILPFDRASQFAKPGDLATFIAICVVLGVVLLVSVGVVIRWAWRRRKKIIVVERGPAPPAAYVSSDRSRLLRALLRRRLGHG